MKAFTKKLIEVLLSGGVMMLAGAVVCFGTGWVVKYFAFDFALGVVGVSSDDEYWSFVQALYVLLLLPPIYIGMFRALPYSEQESIKEGVVVFGVALLQLADWIAKGVLLFVGAYLAYDTFIV
ncbi:hypothetical protein [Vibrio harveyi]|uniref:hypothetical protein n=1 Tax=Vibrio harveyi TaxID=669 RepID=UPI000841601B|nr:hypothetical protein [Vibrio harveyi]ODM56021.1 hypothetical protein BC455_22755 [Vibrio harveyi]